MGEFRSLWCVIGGHLLVFVRIRIRFLLGFLCLLSLRSSVGCARR